MAEGANHIELLINSGLYQKAIHVLNSYLATDGDNLRYQQLLALCYSRSGALDQALEYFEPIFRQHRNDPETTGIMGGIYKRLFAEHQDQAWARKAAETYSNNFDLTGNYYPGINAASMFVMSGKASAGKELSKRIIEDLDNNSNDVWVNGTLAEAYLLIREGTLSKEFYLKTRKLIGNDWGALSSVYKQLWLLNHYISVPRDILKLFAPPKVTIFSGHMIDSLDRVKPRFTNAMAKEIKMAISAAIKNQQIEIGYCSLACGADILFAEAMLEAGKALYPILPFDQDDFLEQSVRFAGDDWEQRFYNIIRKLPAFFISKAPYGGKQESFEFLSKVMMGKAILHAKSIQSEANLLTALSSMSLEAKSGGTRYLFNLWPKDQQSINIDTDRYLTDASVNNSKTVKKYSFTDENIVLSYMVSISAEDGILDSALNSSFEDQLGVTSDNKYYTFHFRNETSVLEFLKRSNLQNNRHALLHAGPVVFDVESKKISGYEARLMDSLAPGVLQDGIMATENFAACLATRSMTALVKYAGQVDIEEQKIALYAVNLT